VYQLKENRKKKRRISQFNLCERVHHREWNGTRV